MTDTCKSILAKLNDSFAGCFNSFFTRSRCSHSPYFVDRVRWEAGQISFFDFDHELTKKEEAEIVAAFFERKETIRVLPNGINLEKDVDTKVTRAFETGNRVL